MKAYILCFLLTILCAFNAQKAFKNDKKKLGIFYSILTVVVPSFIAGVRAIGVGRDINVYVTTVVARSKNARSFLEFFRGANYVEVGYRILIYAVTHFISDRLEVSLFFLQLIPCLCVFIFAYKYREKLSMPLVMATYLLLWYCRSFTVMRQSISIGFVLLGIVFLNEKKYFKVFIFYLLAFLFHDSTILAIPIIPVMLIFNSEKISNKDKFIFLSLILIALSFFIMYYDKILYFLSNTLKLLPEKYANYLNSDYYSSDISTSYSELIYRFICLYFGVTMLMFSKSTDNREFTKYFYLILVEIILYVISFRLLNGERVGYYYRYIGMLYCVPAFANSFKKEKNRIISHITVFLMLFTFWYWKYPIQKNNEAFPYSSTTFPWLN